MTESVALMIIGAFIGAAASVLFGKLLVWPNLHKSPCTQLERTSTALNSLEDEFKEMKQMLCELNASMTEVKIAIGRHNEVLAFLAKQLEHAMGLTNVESSGSAAREGGRKNKRV